MKSLTLITTALLIALNTFAQDSPTPNYKTTFNTLLNKYHIKKQAIQDTLLNKNIATAFSYVILSNSDLAANTSAFGYTQNEEKTNVSINGNLRLGDALSPLFLRVGANATGNKSVFEFYSSDSWQNNVGLNLGLILKVGKSSVFFKGKKEKFDLIQAKRRIRGSEPIYTQKKYTKGVKDKIKKLKDNMLISYGNVLKSHKDLFKMYPEIKKLIEKRKYEDAYVKPDAEEKKIGNYLKALTSQKKLEKYIKNDILYNFDKENDITYGYSLKWFDLNINLGNSTYKFTEDNVDKDILDVFSSEFDIKDNVNKLKSILSFTYNQTHNAKKTIWYYQLGLSTTSGSFLENVLIDGTPKVVQNFNSDFILQDEEGQNLGEFNKIKESLKTGAFNAYGAIFFTKNKNFGFNASLSHNYLMNKPEGIFYKNNFTALIGPIFRKEKDGKTSLTFGIDVGWDNAIYKTKVSNDFTGRIRLGIPFNIYKKEKATKKK